MPNPPEDFQGREVEMHQAITSLDTRRMVVLIGDQDIGKTAIAKAVSLYISERAKFDDGVVYVNVCKVKSYLEFLYIFHNALLNGPIPLANKVKMNTEIFVEEYQSIFNKNNYNNDYISDGESEVKLEEILISYLINLKILIVLDYIDPLLTLSTDISTGNIYIYMISIIVILLYIFKKLYFYIIYKWF